MVRRRIWKGSSDFCERHLNTVLPTHFRDFSLSEKRSFLVRKLNRPLRICGMVKNEGEPGGGPFWVDDPDGRGGASVQIIEESQIDRNDPRQRTVWSSATHFNPVDIVCGVRDFRGRKFDLPAFVDPATAAITTEVGEGEGASCAGEARPLERVDGLLEHRLHRGSPGDLQSGQDRRGSPPATAPLKIRFKID